MTATDGEKLRGALGIAWRMMPVEAQQYILAQAHKRAMSLRAFLDSYRVTWRHDDDGTWHFEFKLKG